MINTHTTKDVNVTVTARAANPLKQNIKKLKIYLSDETKTRRNTK